MCLISHILFSSCVILISLCFFSFLLIISFVIIIIIIVCDQVARGKERQSEY